MPWVEQGVEQGNPWGGRRWVSKSLPLEMRPQFFGLNKKHLMVDFHNPLNSWGTITYLTEFREVGKITDSTYVPPGRGYVSSQQGIDYSTSIRMRKKEFNDSMEFPGFLNRW